MNIPSLVIGLATGLFIGILACILYRNKKAKDDKEKIANAEEEALRIINDAIKSAESKKREATLEAKEEILRSRKEYEKEEKERRADLQKQERRLQQKEENIDRKTDAIEKKEEALAQKHAALDKENEEIKIIKRSQTEMLERISGFTADEAKISAGIFADRHPLGSKCPADVAEVTLMLCCGVFVFFQQFCNILLSCI